jgi:hypothetical protein
MQKSGIQCPDYWVNTGVDGNNNYICKNSFNIPVNKTNNLCKSTEMNFTPIKDGYTWEYGNPNGITSLTDLDKYNFVKKSVAPASLSRCDWVNNCGPSTNVQGIWSGVNEICNNSAPVS